MTEVVQKDEMLLKVGYGHRATLQYVVPCCMPGKARLRIGQKDMRRNTTDGMLRTMSMIQVQNQGV